MQNYLLVYLKIKLFTCFSFVYKCLTFLRVSEFNGQKDLARQDKEDCLSLEVVATWP